MEFKLYFLNTITTTNFDINNLYIIKEFLYINYLNKKLYKIFYYKTNFINLNKSFLNIENKNFVNKFYSLNNIKKLLIYILK